MKKQLISFVAIAALLFSGVHEETQAQNTFPTTAGSSVGIGTLTPAAYLNVVSPNPSTIPFQTQMTGAPNDYLKIVNGTGNTTTFAPTFWGHNTYTGTVIPSLGLVASAPSTCDLANTFALINLNGRQLNSGVGSPILNRNILQVSNYATTLFTIGSTGNVTANGNFQWGQNLNYSTLGTDQGGSIELNGNNNTQGLAGATPYIDFHYGTGAVQDYNMRLINSGNGILEVDGGSLVVSMPGSANPIAGLSLNAGSFNNTTNAQNSYFLRLRDIGAGNKDVFQIKGTGQVLINTTCVPAANVMLAVNGQINATSVQVKLTDGSGCFPDYVFEKDYKLLSLSEVEKYIKTNKHLPEVPSAAEVEKDGMDVASMNTTLLKKIEELTLHMIEMEKKIIVLEKK